jgi:hypothetical protein
MRCLLELKIHFAPVSRVFALLMLLSSGMILTRAAGESNSDLGRFLLDVDGHPVRKLVTPQTHLLVVVFAATDCPISNRYLPEIARIEAEYAAMGVAFRLVYPNPGDTPEIVGRHAAEFQTHSVAWIDTRQELARMAHVSVTPEAAIFIVDNGQLREVYHGRLDDRYIAFGRERPQATKHDLEAAIEAALAGKAVPAAEGGPVGCSIVPRTP